ncbi:MAG: hypothetical protein O7D32_09355 [bacterium]|nr:hypothetical protein [bacterium]
MRYYRLILVLLIIVTASCSTSTPSLELSEKQRSNLNDHVDRIFAGVATEDPEQMLADRQRVADIHYIAFLVEQYRDVAGSYPFVRPGGGIKNVIIGEDNGVSNREERYLSEAEFLAELRNMLGNEVTLRHDPIPTGESGSRHYVYSVYGASYGTAAYLYHPIGWSEGILPNQWQYRLGSSEDLDLPVLQATKLFSGGYGTSRRAQRRTSRAGI